MKYQAVFFDRDGTLGENAGCEFPTQFTPFDNVKQVFAAVKATGAKVYIFTNQSCIARGKDGGYDFAAEFKAYGADDWFICPHDDADRCACRKPKSGLLLEAAGKHGLDLAQCLVVGDRLTDLEAGYAVGAQAVLTLSGRGKETLASAAYQKASKKPAAVIQTLEDITKELTMKVLNIGSLNIDYVYDVDHFVAEGETQSSLGYKIFEGGKGLNQSVALKRAGLEVYHAGKVGKEGKFLADYLKSQGVDTRHVIVSDIENGHAIIQIDPTGKNCILLHGGANMRIGQKEIDAFLEPFGAGDVLVLQNEVNDIPYIIKSARQKGLSVAVNVAPADGKAKAYDLSQVKLIAVNETEGQMLSGETEYAKILQWFAKTYPKACTVLTLGKDGSMCYDAGKTYTQPIIKVKAVDTTSAGDTFFGFFIKKYFETKDPAAAMLLASKASAICVSRNGAAKSIPQLEEVEAWQ